MRAASLKVFKTPALKEEFGLRMFQSKLLNEYLSWKQETNRTVE
jgi:hypothetical protein